MDKTYIIEIITEKFGDKSTTTFKIAPKLINKNEIESFINNLKANLLKGLDGMGEARSAEQAANQWKHLRMYNTSRLVEMVEDDTIKASKYNALVAELNRRADKGHDTE